MPDSPLLASRFGGVLTLSFNNPSARNALTQPMGAALIGALAEAADDPSVVAVVLTGQPPAFCAGQDHAVLRALTPDNVGDWVHALGRLYDAIRAFPKPMVAAIGGAAAGAGLQMALCCDRRIASPAARLMQPELRAGLSSIMGPMLIGLYAGQAAMQRLALACEALDAPTGQAMGLIDQVVPEDGLLAQARAAALAMAGTDATAFRLTKAWIRHMSEPAFRDAIEGGIAAQREAVASGAVKRALG
ncbi:enoyl-CoA hydratase/isomerase family protein [Humitalea sp. 24SJ18S-53]|uniref:enoyl-CoA hydratase/isomerase family protein n=1 Tax=Humitalea sp. 24SJ18S-53 TaxID=3422307 RepID=UPI003D678B71